MEIEVIWVAILAALSVVLGAGITATITYIGTKQHDNRQMNMHRNTLQQQTNEARRDRIVEARKPLLIELRESLSRALGTFITLISTIIIQDPDKPLDPTDLEIPVQTLTDTVELITQLISQISDTTLISAIDVYMPTFHVMLSAINPIEIEAIQKLQDTRTLPTAWLHLRLVNKRIEELLAGDDPT